MVAQSEERLVDVDEYVAHEQTSMVKHEYVHGRVYAMAGGTIDHGTIANNIRAMMIDRSGEGPCRVLGPYVRVRVSAEIYYYPDALVLCEGLPNGRSTEVSNPQLIVEVLSIGTAADDRGDKFANYQSIPTFVKYLLVESCRRSVEHYRHAAPNMWSYQRYDPGATITLETLGLTCPVAAFYQRTDL